MSVTFDKKDDNVVVVIGTGPGGGVLASELAQKGVKVVALEAGGRHGPEDFVNDEWASFVQISWLDSRSTSGDWRVAKDFSGLPSWIVKGVGGSSQHWAGASLRFQEHEWKTKTVYGNVTGASLLDWPIGAKDMDPYYTRAEDKLRVTRTGGRKGLPGNNNYKVFEAGAKKLGYKNVTLDAWQLIRRTMMILSHANKLGFASKDVSGALSGLPVTMKFQLAKQLEIWKSELIHKRLKSSMTSLARSLAFFMLMLTVRNMFKRPELFVLQATR